MVNRDSKGRFSSDENDNTDVFDHVWRIFEWKNLKKLLVLVIIIVFVLRSKNELKSLFATVIDQPIIEASCKRVSEAVIFDALDEVIGGKTPTHGWKKKYEKHKKSINQQKQHKIESVKINIHDEAVNKAFEMIRDEVATKYKDEIKKSDSNFANPKKLEDWYGAKP